jgi:hypothetical protein
LVMAGIEGDVRPDPIWCFVGDKLQDRCSWIGGGLRCGERYRRVRWSLGIEDD